MLVVVVKGMLGALHARLRSCFITSRLEHLATVVTAVEVIVV